MREGEAPTLFAGVTWPGYLFRLCFSRRPSLRVSEDSEGYVHIFKLDLTQDLFTGCEDAKQKGSSFARSLARGQSQRAAFLGSLEGAGAKEGLGLSVFVLLFCAARGKGPRAWSFEDHGCADGILSLHPVP